MLKIYKHIKAQAQIKVLMGNDKKGQPVFQNVKFTGGRNLGSDLGTRGGTYHALSEAVQKALESRSDFGKIFFIDHKIQADKEVTPEEKDFRIFPGIDTINRVTKTLRAEYPNQIKGENLTGTGEILKFCIRVGVAFPDFFTVDQGHFAKKLDEAAEKKQVIFDHPPIPPEETEEVDFQEEGEEAPSTEEYEDVEVDPEELRSLTRKKLDEKALEFGVKSPEGLPNKEAVVQAILNS